MVQKYRCSLRQNDKIGKPWLVSGTYLQNTVTSELFREIETNSGFRCSDNACIYKVCVPRKYRSLHARFRTLEVNAPFKYQSLRKGYV